jgi:hypothetical protein
MLKRHYNGHSSDVNSSGVPSLHTNKQLKRMSNCWLPIDKLHTQQHTDMISLVTSEVVADELMERK